MNETSSIGVADLPTSPNLESVLLNEPEKEHESFPVSNNPENLGKESSSESLININSTVPKIYTSKWESIFPWNTAIYVLQGEGNHRLRIIIESTFDIEYTFPKEGNAFHSAFVSGEDDIHLIVLPFEWINSAQQVALLVHEVSHMCFSIFKRNEYPLPEKKEVNDEEFFNDMLQYWTQKIYEFLNESDRESYLFGNETKV